MAKTYNDLYLDTRQQLRKAGIEAAQLEARELVCYATGKSRDDFFRDSRLYAPHPVERRLEELLSRRLQGEPVAYIIGEWNFYGMPLEVDRTVLIPRPDTEIIAGRAIELAKMAGEHGRVLDLCSGSGCIGLAVAKHAENCRVVLADLSEDAIRLARKNTRRNQLQSRVSGVRLDARENPPDLLWDFNLIVCNPPIFAPATWKRWTRRSGTTSRCWLWTAARTVWTSTASSPESGNLPSAAPAPSSLRWGTTRPETYPTS